LHRLNGEELVVNADLIETLQGEKDTVVILTSGNQLIVREKADDIIAKTVQYKKLIVQEAAQTPIPRVQPRDRNDE
jgi:flagellar protein FlbD